MVYLVNLTDRAARDLDIIYGFINVPGSAGAARWFSRLQSTISLLAAAPHMGKVTREDKAVREVIYGKKPHQYRILYEIIEDEHRIDVLTIWHGRRRPPIA
ncbi:MAG TPA: type II toxin-antitoxin system RelE/ParE family toxin [Acidobacteriaceae bacterium]|nr:type II toxin-antitoxin system RelE/ParE family toxin [Acidobacteriaceae bacterium]